jgi:hypothetical protein
VSSRRPRAAGESHRHMAPHRQGLRLQYRRRRHVFDRMSRRGRPARPCGGRLLAPRVGRESRAMSFLFIGRKRTAVSVGGDRELVPAGPARVEIESTEARQSLPASPPAYNQLPRSSSVECALKVSSPRRGGDRDPVVSPRSVRLLSVPSAMAFGFGVGPCCDLRGTA